MKIFCSYLKERKWSIVSYLAFIGIFLFIFYLYHIRMDAVEYAFLLSGVWFLIVGGAGFLQYRNRHKRLLELEQNIQIQWEEFPEACNLAEEDYQRMLKALFDSRAEQEAEYMIMRQDMMDYYSLWTHQIKTPISAMHVLLQSQEAEFQDSGYFRMMKMELFKVEQYAEMVLSYLRMESMASDMVLQWYPLHELVKQAVRKYSQMFILKKISLRMDVKEVKVLTDEKWLLFVIEQVLSNALKYTKTGSISIYTDENMKLVVEDTGIGIQAEDLPRVYERGFTGCNGRKDKSSTGIGLYLSKMVMDKLAHHISIESEVGKGTRVLMSLERQEIIHE